MFPASVTACGAAGGASLWWALGGMGDGAWRGAGGVPSHVRRAAARRTVVAGLQQHFVNKVGELKSGTLRKDLTLTLQ